MTNLKIVNVCFKYIHPFDFPIAMQTTLLNHLTAYNYASMVGFASVSDYNINRG